MLGHTVPDAAGIRWRRTTEQGVTEWTAVKRYGRNVVVSWSAPPSARVVDRRWKNLDRLLRAVADRAAGQPARGT
jgi:hypothetical protein